MALSEVSAPKDYPSNSSAANSSLVSVGGAVRGGQLFAREGSGGMDGGGTVRRGDYRNEGLYRRRCLQWLQPRLPLGWVLNQVFLGRGAPAAPTSTATAASAAANGSWGRGGGGGG